MNTDLDSLLLPAHIPLPMQSVIRGAFFPSELRYAFRHYHFLNEMPFRQAYQIGCTIQFSPEQSLAALCEFRLQQLSRTSPLRRLLSYREACFLVRLSNFAWPNIVTAPHTQQLYRLYFTRMSEALCDRKAIPKVRVVRLPPTRIR